LARTNIAIGCEYIAALRDKFGGLNEAIAASYNGGEDNAARWLNRSKLDRNATVNERATVDAGVLACESRLFVICL
jgi:soluble lytic murein transglycosylase-like protein